MTLTKMTSTVVVRLWGGLGNQLFIYVFGQYLRHRYNVEVSYDTNTCERIATARKLEISPVVGEFPICNRFGLSTSTGIAGRLKRWAFQLKPKNHLIQEGQPIPEYKQGHNYYFQGYWQNYKYYAWLKKNVESFCLKTINLQEALSAYAKEIIQTEDSVSIHIRRGDFFTPKYIRTYGVCTKEYYNNAIKHIKANHPDARFFVFSDDLQWVMENIFLPEDAVFIPNLEVNPFCYIQLQSYCHHHIISNSTFSWWGAVLSDSKDADVMAPSRWTFNSDFTPVLEAWQKIPV